MAKRGRHPHNRGPKAGQPRHRQHRPRSVRTHQHGPGDLLAGVRLQLASGEPLDFLAQVSAMLAALDPRGRNPFEPQPANEPEHVTLPVLIESFAGAELPETTALLAALAELGPDELSRARAARALASRAHPLPEWLARLGETSVYRAAQSTHVLGDGDNVMLGVRLAGHELTVIIYIDHNLGTVVKDAFPVSGPIDEVIEHLQQLADDPDLVVSDIGFADARARATQGIDKGAITFPPLETDTWPAARPLIEWLLRSLPEGGTGYVWPAWSEAAKKKLAKKFFGSRFGQPLDDAEHRDLLDQVLWFGSDYGPGDPLRWSPVAVEILLADWIPRKIVAEPQYLSKAPDLLRAFIRFCHAERGIRPELTAGTLAAVDEYEPDYQRIIRSPRPQGPAALFAAMGMLGGQGVPWDDEPFEVHQHLLDALAEEVGGQDVLSSLDDGPLPDEEFSWAGIAADQHDGIAVVLAACDRGCDDLLGAEYRTACRRLLARAAPGLAGMLRRTTRPEVIAASLCWVTGKGNHRFGQRAGELRIKDLMTYFGLGQSSVSERGHEIMRAAGITPTGYEIRLGSPDLLVSARRRQIIELRDRHRAALDE